MRTIGLLGGMSWESTAIYYRLANELVRERLGGLHSARILMSSVDFAEMEHLQVTGQWDRAGELLAVEAARLEAAGADLLVLCTNTMHKVAGRDRGRGAGFRCCTWATSPPLPYVLRPGHRRPPRHGVHDVAGLLPRTARVTRAPGARPGRGRPGAGAPGDLRRALPGRRTRGVAARVRRSGRAPGLPRGPGHHPGLHRDRAVDRCPRPAVPSFPHHQHPRRRSRGRGLLDSSDRRRLSDTGRGGAPTLAV